MTTSELQATLEICVQFHKFYNVDLFQRGFYQIRSHVIVSSKLPAKVEVSQPRNKATSEIGPPSTINGTAVTKTFQILYRNEEVTLENVVNFRIHTIVETGKIEESLEKCDIQLHVNLWFSEEGFELVGDSQGATGNFECVSSRVLTLDFRPSRGLHYHVPILFDYFHLSAVSMTVHAALISLHQPYISTSKNGASNAKAKKESRKSKHIPATMETILFGSAVNGKTKSDAEINMRLNSARRIHQEVCSLLLGALESLQVSLLELSNIFLERDRPKVEFSDCAMRLERLSTAARDVKTEEDFIALASGDISQLCGEMVLRWNLFLDTVVGRFQVLQHLARISHLQRVRRFAEAFFVVENVRSKVLECCESKYQTYASIAEAMRTSKYLQLLPKAPVSCVDMDGDANTLPVIFQDVYDLSDSAHFSSGLQKCRRHSYNDLRALEDTSSLSSNNISATHSTSVLQAMEERGAVTTESSAAKAMNPSMEKALQRPSSVPPSKKLEDKKLHSLQNDEKQCEASQRRNKASQGCSQKQHDIPLERKLAFGENSQQSVQENPKVVKQNVENQGANQVQVPRDANGFSHLEWSASVPYNLAEEPDEVCGMKHSHSCHLMPPLAMLEQGQNVKSKGPCTSKGDDDDISTPDKQATMSIDKSIDIEETIRQMQLECQKFNEISLKANQSLLSQKLEEVKAQSRSTIRDQVLQQKRPRAKSEEASKFPLERRPRVRLNSEDLHNSHEDSDLEKREGPVVGTLNAPSLVRTLLDGKGEAGPVKVSSVLPPEQFRDPPKCTPAPCSDKLQKASKIQKSLEERMNKRKSQYDLICQEIEEEENINQRRVSSGAPSEDASAKGAQTVSKSSHFPSDDDTSFVVEHTGDCMENKSLPKPKKQAKNDLSSTVCDKNVSHVVSTNKGQKRIVPAFGEHTLAFVKAKEEFKRSLPIPSVLFSDISGFVSGYPYFHLSTDVRLLDSQGLHLIVCVHGLDGNSADLRLIKTYLEMALPGYNMDFLMSEMNQGDTFSNLETMTDRLVDEIHSQLRHYSSLPSRISFVGHSLGCILIRSAITRPKMANLVPRFYTYLSLSGPHLGTLYNNSGLVNMGMWFMQKWKKPGSLHQLCMKDASDIRKTFLYQLSLKSNLHKFRHVLLAGSTQDRYVPWHSARIELCKSAVKDTSVTGSAYKEMVHNILSPIVTSGKEVSLIRYDIHHALPTNTNAFIGRAAHIAVLDSELFIEKFLVISALKYFQ